MYFPLHPNEFWISVKRKKKRTHTFVYLQEKCHAVLTEMLWWSRPHDGVLLVFCYVGVCVRVCEKSLCSFCEGIADWQICFGIVNSPLPLWPCSKSCWEVTQLTPLTKTSKMCYLVVSPFMQTVLLITRLVIGANVDVASPCLPFVCLFIMLVSLAAWPPNPKLVYVGTG